jgi:hypothetical protein
MYSRNDDKEKQSESDNKGKKKTWKEIVDLEKRYRNYK